jgi:hypothetical protein
VSAPGIAKVLPVASPYVINLCAVLLHRVNALAAFTLVKVGLRLCLRSHGRFPFECPATVAARTRVHVRASHAGLHHLNIIEDAEALSLVSIDRRTFFFRAQLLFGQVSGEDSPFSNLTQIRNPDFIWS